MAKMVCQVLEGKKKPSVDSEIWPKMNTYIIQKTMNHGKREDRQTLLLGGYMIKRRPNFKAAQ